MCTEIAVVLVMMIQKWTINDAVRYVAGLTNFEIKADLIERLTDFCDNL